MQRRTRRVLFFIAVIVFAGASYLAVLMAQGYTYDFALNKFVLTGAVAVTANVDAQVAVNDVAADAMSFLTHRTGVDRLLPGSYTVTVNRDGYSAWRKSATVQEGLLTDFPHVLLLPTDPQSVTELKDEFIETLKQSRTLADATGAVLPKSKNTPVVREVAWNNILLRGEQLWRTDTASASMIADKVLGFALTDNSDRVLWWTQSDLWTLWLEATDYQPFRKQNEKAIITRFGSSPVRAAWFRDRDHIIVDLGSGYRIYETDLRGGVNIIKF